LYGVGAFISYATRMPIALVITTVAQGLFLVTILFTYINNLAANVVFILAIIMTITNIVVLGYEVKRVPSSNQEILGFIDAVLPQPA
jgi:membrane protein YdbS with pleckstrin-like domain